MRTVLAAAAQPSGGVEALGVPGGGESRGREAPKPGPGTRGLNDIAASVTSEPQDKARPRHEDARNGGSVEQGAHDPTAHCTTGDGNTTWELAQCLPNQRDITWMHMNAAGRRSRSHNGRDGAHNHDPNASAATLSRHGITDALTASVSCDGRTPSRSTGSPHPNREPHAAVRPQHQRISKYLGARWEKAVGLRVATRIAAAPRGCGRS